MGTPEIMVLMVIGWVLIARGVWKVIVNILTR
jgi:hypothetical protein